MNEFAGALRTHQMWFGSYTKAGELKKVQVWCLLYNGNIEFLTAGDSLKAKRAGRNPRVVCHLGSENGPSISGAAEIVREPGELERGYRTYWKTHRIRMIVLSLVIRGNIRAGRQIMIRVRPDEPNPLAGLPNT